MENLFKTLFPEECLFCQIEGTSFCLNCLDTCELLTYGVCLVCHQRSYEGLTHTYCLDETKPKSIFSPFLYKDKVRECIIRSKYSYREFSSLKELTYFGSVYYSQTSPVLDNFVVVSVPLSWGRYKQRGFNQVDIVSKTLARVLKLPFEDTVLVRHKETSAQAGQSKLHRHENMVDAFSVNKYKNVVGKKFLLVDDICTTGSTLLECAKVLYAAGAPEVRCFTVARVL